MRGLSIVGLLVALGVVGWLVTTQLQSTTPEGAESAPTETIDRANEAADQIEDQAEQRQQELNPQPE